MEDATSGAVPPNLPLDVLQDVVDLALDGLGSEGRELAAAISLVCRDLRDVGQKALLTTITFPRPPHHARSATPPSPRLANFVRSLAWSDPQWRAPREEVISSQEELFMRTVQRCPRLDRVELVGYDRHRFVSLLASLSSSFSRTTLSHLTIAVTAPFTFNGAGTLFTSQDLLEYLLGFPSLKSFAGDVWRLLPDGPSPPLQSLPLSAVDISDQVLDSTAAAERRRKPYEDFLRAVDPSTLRAVTLFRSWMYEDLLPLVDSLHFHLTSLTIYSHPGDTTTFFTILPSLLSHQPALQHFSLLTTDRPLRTDDFSLGDFFRALWALPPSLQTLTIDFRLDLDEYLLAFFQHGPCQKLKHARIETWYTSYTRTWREDLQVYDEVVPPEYLE
ncbi:hypothetical protein JCM6882_006463 [Rhodosporidiobolus microsporus]